MHENITNENEYNFCKISFGKINNENHNDNKYIKIKYRLRNLMCLFVA